MEAPSLIASIGTGVKDVSDTSTLGRRASGRATAPSGSRDPLSESFRNAFANAWQPDGIGRRNYPVNTEDAQRRGGEMQRPTSTLTEIIKRYNFTEDDLPRYLCDCGKSFTRADNLRRHELSDKNVPFACDVEGCLRAYHSRGLLKKHKADHHGIADEERRERPRYTYSTRVRRPGRTIEGNDGEVLVAQDDNQPPRIYRPVSREYYSLPPADYSTTPIMWKRGLRMAADRNKAEQWLLHTVNSSIPFEGGPAPRPFSSELIPTLSSRRSNCPEMHHAMSGNRHLSTALKLEGRFCCNDQSLADALRLR